MTRRLLVVLSVVLAVVGAIAPSPARADEESQAARRQRAVEAWFQQTGGGAAGLRTAAAGASADPAGDPFTSDIGATPDPRGDIVQVAADYGFESLTVSLDVAAGEDPATDPSWTEGSSFAAWVVDVDNDGIADYLVGLFFDGGLIAEVVKFLPDENPDDAEPPPFEPVCAAAAAFSGNRYSASFPAHCVGFPPVLSFGALLLLQIDPADPESFQVDLAPDEALAGPIARADLPIPATNGRGYWIAAADGGIFAFGDAGFHGSTGNIALVQPILGMFPTPSALGYWLGASDGGIFALGDADFFGSMGDTPLNQPIVGVASTPTGRGYWMVARDGGIFAFGDASFFGSMGDQPLNQPIVGMAATPTGRGYWMVASDGGMFAFGDAAFFGSTGDRPLNQPITGMAPAPSGLGYWLVAADGGIFAFGPDGRFFGSGVTESIANPLIAVTRTGNGYWLLDKNSGRVEGFGDAVELPDLAGLPLNQPIVAFARTP